MRKLFTAFFISTLIAFPLLSIGKAHAASNWSYATPSASPITNATAVVLKAASQGNKNYISSLQIYNTHATVSTVVNILKGSTVIWTGYAPATTAALVIVPTLIELPRPLESDTNQALSFQAVTTGANIYVSAQGYTGRL